MKKMRRIKRISGDSAEVGAKNGSYPSGTAALEMSHFRNFDDGLLEKVDPMHVRRGPGAATPFPHGDGGSEIGALAGYLKSLEAEELRKAEVKRKLAEELNRQRIQFHRDQFEAAPWYIKAPVAVQDMAAILTDGVTLGAAKYPVAALESAFSDETFADRLKAYDANIQAASDRAGSAGTVARIYGGALTGRALAGSGLALAGRFGSSALSGLRGGIARTGLAGADGAILGGVEAAIRGESIPDGMLSGGVSGVIGGAADEWLPKQAFRDTDIRDFVSDMAGGGPEISEAAAADYAGYEPQEADADFYPARRTTGTASITPQSIGAANSGELVWKPDVRRLLYSGSIRDYLGR